MRPTKNKEPNTKMNEQKIKERIAKLETERDAMVKERDAMQMKWDAIEMLQDLSAYCTLFADDAHLGRVINHDHAAIVELLHTGSTEVLPYSYGAKKKLDAKQINELN